MIHVTTLDTGGRLGDSRGRLGDPETAPQVIRDVSRLIRPDFSFLPDAYIEGDEEFSTLGVSIEQLNSRGYEVEHGLYGSADEDSPRQGYLAISRLAGHIAAQGVGTDNVVKIRASYHDMMEFDIFGVDFRRMPSERRVDTVQRLCTEVEEGVRPAVITGDFSDGQGAADDSILDQIKDYGLTDANSSYNHNRTSRVRSLYSRPQHILATPEFTVVGYTDHSNIKALGSRAVSAFLKL